MVWKVHCTERRWDKSGAMLSLSSFRPMLYDCLVSASRGQGIHIILATLSANHGRMGTRTPSLM